MVLIQGLCLYYLGKVSRKHEDNRIEVHLLQREPED